MSRPDEYNDKEVLQNLKDSLNKIGKKSSLADVAKLFDGPESPMVKLEEVANARLEYLSGLQSDLVKVKLTLQAGDNVNWGFEGKDIDKKTAAIKNEIDEIREFNKVFSELKKIGTSEKARDQLAAKLDLQDRISSKKASFVEVAKNYISNFIKAVKAKIYGKPVDMASLESGIKAIGEHTSNLQSENQEIAGRASQFVKEVYSDRVKQAQAQVHAEPKYVRQAKKLAEKIEKRHQQRKANRTVFAKAKQDKPSISR